MELIATCITERFVYHSTNQEELAVILWWEQWNTLAFTEQNLSFI